METIDYRTFQPRVTETLDRLADFVLSNNVSGYLIRLATEPIPLIGIWSIGDILGLMRGWKDYRLGAVTKGVLKMIVAVIPFWPTIPTHFVIDRFMPDRRLA